MQDLVYCRWKHTSSAYATCPLPASSCLDLSVCLSTSLCLNNQFLVSHPSRELRKNTRASSIIQQVKPAVVAICPTPLSHII